MDPLRPRRPQAALPISNQLAKALIVNTTTGRTPSR